MAWSPVEVGIVGLGRIADLHAQAHRTHGRSRIRAICDSNPATLERRRVEWGVESAYLDWRDLLADPAVEAVEVLLPHHLHHPVTVAAAAAGKHVCVQKPMALDVAQCDEMIDACRRAGVLLQVFDNFLFHPPYRRARELVAQGAVGEPRAIRMKNGITLEPGGWDVPLDAWAWRMDRDQCGPGVITFDDGFHKLDVARWMLGPIERVSGWIEWTELMPGSGLRIDAPACFTWKHREPGRFGVMDVTLSRHLAIPSRYYPMDEQVEVTGDRGVLYLTRCTADMTLGAPLVMFSEGRWSRFDDLEDDWASGFREASRAFAEAVRGAREPELSGEEARHVTQVALACHVAADRGGWVRVDDVG
ncbi:MAG: Gfo/Idh/MocA family oxidoreductase [Deltaproteobacteria bacterium]|nr:Gfo/Idh/MocA family oxidoreductase [Deltaproteobacteria bacterium]